MSPALHTVQDQSTSLSPTLLLNIVSVANSTPKVSEVILEKAAYPHLQPVDTL